MRRRCSRPSFVPGRPFPCGVSAGSFRTAISSTWIGWTGHSRRPSSSCCTAAAALSVPFDLALCADALDGPGAMAWVYRTRFLRGLKAKALEKAGRFPGLDVAKVRGARTLREFDEAITGPVHGFAGATDYYAQSSSGQYVSRVRTPLLLLSAEDDPFIPPQCLPRDAAEENRLVTLETLPRGGHLGFVAGRWLPRFYAEVRAIEFLASHL